MQSLRIFLILAITVSSLMAQGTPWELIGPPEGRADAAMSYLPGDRNVYLFGGADGGLYFNDFWQLSQNGGWTQLSLKPMPAARSRAAMTRTVDGNGRPALLLFGGRDNNGVMGDTWLFNGTRWISLNIPENAGPSPREGAAISFNVNDGYTYLFGGKKGNTFYDDLWRFRGGEWEKVDKPFGPSARMKAGFAQMPDEKGLILYGGENADGALEDCYIMRDKRWFKYNSDTPGRRTAHTLVYSPGEGHVLCLGGYYLGSNMRDVWMFKGGTWRQLEGEKWLESPLSGVAGTFARWGGSLGRVVTFGGWDGVSVSGKTHAGYDGYLFHFPEDVPRPVTQHAAAYYPRLKGMVVFGGVNGVTSFNNETWFWKIDQGWTRLFPQDVPERRTQAEMVYDPASDRLILHGGYAYIGNQLQEYTDTWAFDGNNWTKLSDAGPIQSGAMAYHPPTGEIVLFEGGEGYTTGATYAFRNNAWVEIASADNGVEIRRRSSMGYDPASGMLVMVGGQQAHFSRQWPEVPREIMHFDGTRWYRTNTMFPGRIMNHQLVYDTISASLFVVGGLEIITDPNSYNPYYGYFQEGRGKMWEIKNIIDAEGQHGAALRQITDRGPDVSGHTVVYDAYAKRLIMFGGLSNNEYTNQVYVYQPGYTNRNNFDIGIPFTKVSDMIWSKGENILVQARVRNFGPKASKPVALRVYLSDDDELSLDDVQLVPDEAVPVLQKNQSRLMKWSVDVTDLLDKKGGQIFAISNFRPKFYVLFAVDPDESERDPDVSNNLVHVAGYITIDEDK